jgi:TonB family protein
MRVAAQASCRWRPLSSNVSHHMHHLAAALGSLLLAACAANSPSYQVAGQSDPSTRHAAERKHAEIVHASATVHALDAPLRILKSVFPDYPESFRNADISGVVRIEFFIERDGRVSSPTVIGSPPAELAALSLHAIMRWRFAPPTIAGSPVRVQAAQQFNFKIE